MKPGPVPPFVYITDGKIFEFENRLLDPPSRSRVETFHRPEELLALLSRADAP